VFANKLWPHANSVETYRFYNFPFCQPPVIYPQFMTLGQVMRGDRLMNSLYEFSYLKNEPEPGVRVCTKYLSEDEITKLKRAIEQYYVVELYVSDLPLVFTLGLRAGVPPLPGHENIVDTERLSKGMQDKL